MIRAFIAVDLPEVIKNELERISQQFKIIPTSQQIKGVDPKNLHITLKFLGNTQPETLNLIAEKIKKEVHPFKQFDLSLSELGAFPNLHRPNVIWVDVEPKNQLVLIYKTIERICVSEGFAPDQKPFKTHITLARVKQGTSTVNVKQIASLLQNLPPPSPIVFQVDGIAIIQSILQPQGPLYTPFRHID